MKGSTFRKVVLWYQLLTENVESLVRLPDEELSNQVILKPSKPPNTKGISSAKNVYRTLNILKAGFYSNNEEVV